MKLKTLFLLPSPLNVSLSSFVGHSLLATRTMKALIRIVSVPKSTYEMVRNGLSPSDTSPCCLDQIHLLLAVSIALKRRQLEACHCENEADARFHSVTTRKNPVD